MGEIDDHSPERRNLASTALAFITYFVAGGYFSGDVSLSVISLHFQRGWALAVLAWMMLLWFAYRYWVVTKGHALEKLAGEMTIRLNQDDEFRALALREYKGTQEVSLATANGGVIEWKRQVIEVVIHRAAGGHASSLQLRVGNHLPRRIFLRALAKCAINDPTISTFMPAWVLFWISVLLGALNLLWSVIN